MHLEKIIQIPNGVQESLSVLDQIDECLLTGFARLSTEQMAFFPKLAAIFSGTAFEQPLTNLSEACQITTFQTEHFVYLAAARSAINGAIYDALWAQTTAELKYHFEPSLTTPIETEHPLLISCTEWLKEVALVGWEGLRREQLQHFSQTLDNLLEKPELRRQSTLLTGLVNELGYSIPIGNGKPVPLRRWTDLWARALMNCQGELAKEEAVVVSGTFKVLGSEILQHNNAVALRVYGILEVEGKQKFTQFSVQAFKVDTIMGFEAWKLFNDFPKLLKILSDNLSIKLDEIRLHSSGFWEWEEEKVTLQQSVDALALAASELEECHFYKVPAYDRHPVHFKLPIYLKDYQMVESTDTTHLQIGETSILVDTHRFSAMSVLTVDKLATSTECFGLLHFDNQQWRLQPLAVRCGKTTVHNGLSAVKVPAKLLKQKVKSTDSFKILKERAAKLLRS